VNDRGEFPELPYDMMMKVFHDKYPYMFEHLEPGERLESNQWEDDVDREIAGH